jgi:hypothetical protein
MRKLAALETWISDRRKRMPMQLRQAPKKEGNKLFDQGKYEDAQKAYLEAKTETPHRPETLHKLGSLHSIQASGNRRPVVRLADREHSCLCLFHLSRHARGA